MMSMDAKAALPRVFKGIGNALELYGSMAGGEDANARLIRQICDLHVRHAAEIGQRLKALEMPIMDGPVNVTARPDCVETGMTCSLAGSATLNVVRQAEAELARIYDRVLVEFDFQADRTSGRLLTSQRRRLDHLAWRLSRTGGAVAKDGERVSIPNDLLSRSSDHPKVVAGRGSRDRSV